MYGKFNYEICFSNFAPGTFLLGYTAFFSSLVIKYPRFFVLIVGGSPIM